MYNVVLLQDELSLAYFFHYYAINKVKKKVIWFIPYIFFKLKRICDMKKTATVNNFGHELSC